MVAPAAATGARGPGGAAGREAIEHVEMSEDMQGSGEESAFDGEVEVEAVIREHVFGLLEGMDLSMAPYVDPEFVRLTGAISARLRATGVARSPWADGAVAASVRQFVEGRWLPR